MNGSTHDRNFFLISQLSIALGMGIFFGFVWSIQEVTPNFLLQFSFGVIVAFFIGATAGALAWKSVWKARDGFADKKLKRRLLLWGIGFAVFTIGAFARGLRGQPSDKIREFIIGSGIALIFLTIGGILLFQLFRFFQNDKLK